MLAAISTWSLPTNHHLVPTDFLCWQMVIASAASYLGDIAVLFCCRPGIMVSATREDEERFQKELGGEIMSLMEVRDYLRPKSVLAGNRLRYNSLRRRSCGAISLLVC